MTKPISTATNELETPYLTSWCGGEPGNKSCDYHCKLCLIATDKAELVDVQGSKFTYRIVEES